MSAALVHFILRNRESRVHRNIPDRCDPLHFRDEDLLRMYRFPRTVIIDITSSLEDHLTRKTRRNKALSPVLQVCVTLKYHGRNILEFLVEISAGFILVLQYLNRSGSLTNCISPTLFDMKGLKYFAGLFIQYKTFI